MCERLEDMTRKLIVEKGLEAGIGFPTGMHAHAYWLINTLTMSHALTHARAHTHTRTRTHARSTHTCVRAPHTHIHTRHSLSNSLSTFLAMYDCWFNYVAAHYTPTEHYLGARTTDTRHSLTRHAPHTCAHSHAAQLIHSCAAYSRVYSLFFIKKHNLP